MKFHTVTIGDKDVNFRLTSADAEAIEDKSKSPILDFITNVTMTNCVTTLMYMRKSEIPNFSKRDAQNLFDELADNDFALETIYKEIIFPTCVVSGLLTMADLNKALTRIEEAKTEQATEE